MKKIINNFPENYPWYKRLISNILFLVLGTIILPRKNTLSNKDIRKTRKLLKRGDIILGGDSRTLFSKIVSNPITHTMLYLGGKRIIHSIGKDGVRYDSLRFVFTKYDTLMVLRIPEDIENKKEVIKETLQYAESQYKKPYDFELKPENESFYCAELVSRSFKEAGYNTGLKPNGKIIRSHDFLKANFNLIFKSHNLK